MVSKVAIILPTYNSERYIEESLNSIFGQRFDDFSLIVVNDGSTDGTEAILNSFNDSRLKVVNLSHNTGVATARNIGIQIASESDYLAIMDADDVCLPDRLGKQIEFLNENQEISIVGTRIRLFDEMGNESEFSHPIEDGEIKARMLLLNGTAMSHPTTMIRNDFLRANFLLYPQPMRPIGEDHEFWINCILRKAKFAALPDVLLRKRRHKNNMSANFGDVKYSRIKTETRQKLISMFYPNLNMGEAKSLASLFQENKKITLAEICLAYVAAEKALQDSASYFGESKEILSRIIKSGMARWLKQLQDPN